MVGCDVASVWGYGAEVHGIRGVCLRVETLPRLELFGVNYAVHSTLGCRLIDLAPSLVAFHFIRLPKSIKKSPHSTQ